MTSGPGNDAASRRPAGGRFATTRWSIVLAAGASDAPRAREAMTALCEQYWFPLYAFARSRGSGPEEAEDLTQGFFAHVLEKHALRNVDPDRGRFRSFLLASFRHFISDERSRQQAKKRGGGVAALSLDAAAAEERYALEPVDELTPEKTFERQWALTVIEQTVARLRERYASRGKLDHFEALKVFLSGEKRPVPYAEVAPRLGISELAVKVAVHRLRKRFRDALREEIAQTVSAKAEIDEELRALYSALEG